MYMMIFELFNHLKITRYTHWCLYTLILYTYVDEVIGTPAYIKPPILP